VSLAGKRLIDEMVGTITVALLAATLEIKLFQFICIFSQKIKKTYQIKVHKKNLKPTD
jgi:hypothetical protein